MREREEDKPKGTKISTLITIATIYWIATFILGFIVIFYPASKTMLENFFFSSIPIAFWLMANILLKIEKLYK